MRFRQLASSLLAALALTATTLSPVLARADEPLVAEGSMRRGGDDGAPIAAMPPAQPAPEADQSQTVQEWYGYQNLAADGAAFALAMAAGSTENREAGNALGWLSFGTYVLASPIIHGLHGGGVGRSLASGAMRLGLPVLGAVIGGSMASCDGREGCWDDLGGIALGGLIGIGTAIVIDDLALSVEEHHVERPMWTPTVAPSAGGMTFGVAGTF
jgi:hypothetical protein